MKKIISYIILLVIIICFVMLFFFLKTNKTFFKTSYIGIDKKERFIPKYSYFKSECCMTSALFYSLKSKHSLEKEINYYLDGFEYFENDSTYGYKKDDVFIQAYKVEDNGLYRKIIITY